MNNARNRLAKLATFLPGTLFVICLLLVMLEFAYHKHPYFAVEGWFGFYPLVGFLSTFAWVLIARGLGFGLRRAEDNDDR